MLNKEKFNEIDVKLLKGIFLRSTEEKKPKKGIKETFTPYTNEPTSSSKK